MTAVEKRSVVAVTGAAGFVGGHVVQEALARGHRVRACVRNVDDDARVGFLKAMNPYASGRLTLHAADLDEPGCFDSIFRGCDAVAHVSHVSTYDDPDYVRRTCDHVINSVESSGTVRRVVVTSSIAAIISEADITELVRRPIVDEDREPDESNPKRTPERGQGYSMGKVIAQHAFSDAAADSGRWDAITVCPSDNVGPILSPHHKDGGPWQHLIERMLEGRCEIFQGTGPYRPWMTVDVRDDAACHVGLLESDKVTNGERYLAMSTETRSYEDICTSIDRLLPELRHDPGPIVDPSPDRWKERQEEFRSIWARTAAAQRPHAGRGADHVPPARRLDPRLCGVTPRGRSRRPEPASGLSVDRRLLRGPTSASGDCLGPLSGDARSPARRSVERHRQRHSCECCEHVLQVEEPMEDQERAAEKREDRPECDAAPARVGQRHGTRRRESPRARRRPAVALDQDLVRTQVPDRCGHDHASVRRE